MAATSGTPNPTIEAPRVRAGSISWQRIGTRGLIYIALIGGAAIFILPLAWLVTTSVKPEPDVFLFPPNLIPSSFEWRTYPGALARFPFLHLLRNTMIIVIGVEVGRLLSSTLAAYAFARLRFPFRNTLFVVVLSTMMLPYHVTLIPQFLIFRELHWLDTFLPLTVPAWFATSAFYVFLLRQFFLQIPMEYDDSAEIDGCSPIGTYWYIILPMSMPALGAVAIFTFMAEWNDYLAPLIYLNSLDNYTLALYFRLWERGAGTGYIRLPPFNQTMAIATMITVIPMLVFFFAQRYFIQGVVISGVKG